MDIKKIVKSYEDETVLDIKGRVYYNMPSKWDTAYKMYTEANVPSLNYEQSVHMVDILNQKKYNFRLLIMGFVWLVLFCSFIAISPSGVFHDTSGWVTAIFTLLQVGIFAWNVRKYIIAPFDHLYLLLPELIACTFVYFIIWQL